MNLECLKTLQFNNTRYDNISDPHRHTFNWLLELAEYHEWESSDSSSLFFVEGKPGSGKSTLSRFINQRLAKNFDSVIIAKFFYSYRDGGKQANHRKMLQSLYGILKANESFFVHFQRKYRQMKLKQLDDGTVEWEYGTLKEILLSCRNHHLESKLFLVVDAMDESDHEDRIGIFRLLRDMSALTNNQGVIKVFLTSRPITELPMDFPKPILLQEKNKDDIMTYTESCLADPDCDIPQDIKTQVKEHIVTNAKGVFLWVQLIAKELTMCVRRGLDDDQILQFLEDIPKELESFYERMIVRLHNDNKDFPIDIEHSKQIFRFCLLSHRAVKLAELQHALAVPVHPGGFRGNSSIQTTRLSNMKKRVTHCAGNFVEITGICSRRGTHFFKRVMSCSITN